MTQPDCPVALVVEDDDATRHFASAVLEETDLDVIACKDAEAAMSVLQRPGVNVALLFSDMRNTGGVDGAALARMVAKRFPTARMVMTSGSERNVKGALPDRAVYMQKPWLPLEVLVQAERAAVEANGEAA